jgi:hypothetical protein
VLFGHRAVVQEILDGLPGDHSIRDRIGMSLADVAGGADASLQLNAAPLLNDMGGLVRDGVQIGAAPQDDVVAGRVRVGAHGLRGRGGFPARVRPDRRDVVATERALQRIGERKA